MWSTCEEEEDEGEKEEDEVVVAVVVEEEEALFIVKRRVKGGLRNVFGGGVRMNGRKVEDALQVKEAAACFCSI